MADYFFTLGLLAAPILICRTRTCRPGLVTGLFISLFFWAKAVPLLLLIPLSAAFYLCFAAGKQPPGEKKSALCPESVSSDAVPFYDCHDCILRLRRRILPLRGLSDAGSGGADPQPSAFLYRAAAGTSDRGKLVRQKRLFSGGCAPRLSGGNLCAAGLGRRIESVSLCLRRLFNLYVHLGIFRTDAPDCRSLYGLRKFSPLLSFYCRCLRAVLGNRKISVQHPLGLLCQSIGVSAQPLSADLYRCLLCLYCLEAALCPGPACLPRRRAAANRFKID